MSPCRAALSVASALAFCTAIAPRPAVSQDVRFVSVTKTEMVGPMAAMASRMPGMGEETEDVTYMKGTKMRTDREGSSFLYDMATGDMIQLDHGARTYTRINLSEMSAAMSDAGSSAGQGEGEPSLRMDFSVERTGRTETINGLAAEQVLLITKMESTGDGAMAGMPGKMASVMELWLSTEAPQYERMKAWQERMSEALGDGAAAGPMMSGMGAQMVEAMRQSAEAMKDLDGVAVRSVVRSVVVPEGKELDVEAALAAEGGEGGGAAGSVADAARSALGRFGRMGRGGGGASEEQLVLMIITSETRDFEETSLDDALFEPPSDYTEKPMQLPGRPR